MPFLDDVLRPPSYGWKDDQGLVVKPTLKQLFSEYFSRINIFRSRKNWLCFYDFMISVVTTLCFVIFIAEFLSWLTAIAFILGVFVLSIHQTIWFHRYCTHYAFKFKNSFWRMVTQNITFNAISEEAYVISHHVHHLKSDRPGDPYNAGCGFFYCYLANVNHQQIAFNLDERSYNKVKRLMKHTGVQSNSYEEYLYWGTYTNFWNAMWLWGLNWLFWCSVFYILGGTAMLLCLLGTVGFWLTSVRMFNYVGHAYGQKRHREGNDFYIKDQSVNQIQYGIVAGEWHNNHHLFPTSARSGFKPGQIDMAWYYIKFLSKIGAVVSYKDYKKQFYEQYYIPYLNSKSAVAQNC